MLLLLWYSMSRKSYHPVSELLPILHLLFVKLFIDSITPLLPEVSHCVYTQTCLEYLLSVIFCERVIITFNYYHLMVVCCFFRYLVENHCKASFSDLKSGLEFLKTHKQSTGSVFLLLFFLTYNPWDRPRFTLAFVPLPISYYLLSSRFTDG